MHDLAAEASAGPVVKRLTSLLQEHQRQAGDNQPLTTDKPQPLEFDFSKAKHDK